jgi:cell division protein FtsL
MAAAEAKKRVAADRKDRGMNSPLEQLERKKIQKDESIFLFPLILLFISVSDSLIRIRVATYEYNQSPTL